MEKLISGHLNNIQNAVRKFLELEPGLRDDDNRLLANIWYEYIMNTMQYTLTPEQLDGISKLLGILAQGDLPNWESVRRSRQKLQEENPELRGRLWERRHRAQSHVADEIRNWSDATEQGSFFE